MNKIRILLLNPPYKEKIIRDNYCCLTSKADYIWPPIDLLYLSGILNNKKAKLKVIDAVAENFSWEQVFLEIEKFFPHIIISLTGTVSYKEDLLYLAKIKNSKIYLIGNTPAFLPQFFLKKYPFIDGVIHNFFDLKILDFFINNDLNCESISYKLKNGQFKFGKINFLKPLSEVKLNKPPLYHLFNLDKYSTPFIKNKPMVTMMTSFGCPFHCKFCVASALNYYSRHIEDIKKEFDTAKKFGIKEIFFEDSTFNANISYTKKILELMIKNDYKFSWSANVHSFNLNDELLILMKRAGCHTLQIGVESGDEEILKEYAPSKRKDQLKKVFYLCKKHKIQTLGYFIIGFPKETKEKAKKTISFAKELDPDFASFSVLTPDYGTKLYEEIKNKKIDNNIPTFDSSDEAFIENPNFSTEEQNQYIKRANFEFYFRPKKLFKYLLNKNFFLYFKNGIKLILKKILK